MTPGTRSAELSAQPRLTHRPEGKGQTCSALLKLATVLQRASQEGLKEVNLQPAGRSQAPSRAAAAGARRPASRGGRADRPRCE